MAVLILPVIGVWFLWKNTQFARQRQPARRRAGRRGRPARRRPGAHPERPHRPGLGRRGLRQRRKAETEDAPDDWRAWFRLAVAYHDARDTPRARKAMQRAIALHDGKPGPARPPFEAPIKPVRRLRTRPACTQVSPGPTNGPGLTCVRRHGYPCRYSSAQASTASAARSNASARARKSALWW